jgi:hypothetical protein
MVPVMASTSTDKRTMECAGVDSGEKMLVVKDASLLPAAERVSGTRTKAAIKSTRGDMSVLFGAFSTCLLTRFGSTFGFMRLPVIQLQRQPK